jgi:hypothetical protein
VAILDLTRDHVHFKMFDTSGHLTLILVVLAVFLAAIAVNVYILFVIILLVLALLAGLYLKVGSVPETLAHVSALFSQCFPSGDPSDTDSGRMIRSTSADKQSNLPNIRTLKLTPKKSNNENRMSSPIPSSPRYLSRGRSTINSGIFGIPKMSPVVNQAQSPKSNPNSPWNKSILGDVQNQSLLGNDLTFSKSTLNSSLNASKHSSPLPRVHRHYDRLVIHLKI